MIEIQKTYVVCEPGKSYGNFVTAIFLQQNGKYLCRFHKGTEPPFAFKEKNLLTVEKWNEKRENKEN